MATYLRSKTMKKGQRLQGLGKRVSDPNKYGESSGYTSSYKETVKSKKLPPLKAHYTDSDLHKANAVTEKRPNTFYERNVRRQRTYNRSYYKSKNGYKDRHSDSLTDPKIAPRKAKITETSKEPSSNPTSETPEKTSWSHAVKKINYIKHYERQLRNHLKRREQAAQKRQKSEFRVINTWLPKEPRASERYYRQSDKTKMKTQPKQNRKTEPKSSNEKSPYLPKRKLTKKESQKVCEQRQTEASIQSFDGREMEGKSVKISPPKTINRSPSNITPNKNSKAQKQKQGDNNKPIQPDGLQKDQTSVNQINLADFANLEISVTRNPVDIPINVDLETLQTPPKSPTKQPKPPSKELPIKPLTPTKSDAQAICIAHNDALLANMSQTRRLLKKKDNNPPTVERIMSNGLLMSNGGMSNNTPPVVDKISSKSLLMPNGGGRSNTFMDMLITDAKKLSSNNYISAQESENALPRLGLRTAVGSPIPMISRSETRSPAGEITLIVPKLPQLNRKQSTSSLLLPPSPRLTASSTPAQSGDEEPLVVVTNERGVMNKALDDGLESGYNSLTPRVSQDRLITPIRAPSSMYLGVPSMIGDRSTTPLSTITTSTMLELNHSRPSSSFLDIPVFNGHLDSSDHSPKKFLSETRPPLARLPAINSRNTDNDDHRYDFTPIPLQSIRTSDGEMSD